MTPAFFKMKNPGRKKSFPLAKTIAALLFTIPFIACEKDSVTECANSQAGILRDFTGLDGCGWIIQLADSSRIEPINLNDFEIELIDDKAVCVRFYERTDMGSYCMVGKVVEIDFIE